jgi:hypothetical protein
MMKEYLGSLGCQYSLLDLARPTVRGHLTEQLP